MLSLPALHPPLIPAPSLPNSLPHHPSTTSTNSHNPAFTTTTTNGAAGGPHHHHHHPNAPIPRGPPSPTLIRLCQDESLLQRRRSHIARFGSTWLRPPGIPKTLQGMEDERVERAEAEAMRAREAELAMMAEEAEVEVEEEAGEEGMEADLDGEVPDADADAEEGWTEEEEEEGEEGEGSGEEAPMAGFAGDETEEEGEGEEGGIEGLGMFEGEGDYGSSAPPRPSRQARQQQGYNIHAVAMVLPEWATRMPGGAVLTPRTPAGVATPAMGGMSDGAGMDLDASVPEAGSYEHTDTEVEDASSADDEWADTSRAAGHAAIVGRSSGRGGWVGGHNSIVGAQASSSRGGGSTTTYGTSGAAAAAAAVASTPPVEELTFEQRQQRRQLRRQQALGHGGVTESERRSERRRNAFQTPSFDAALGNSSFDGGMGMDIGEDSLLGGSVFGSSPLAVGMGLDGIGGVLHGRASSGQAGGVSGSGGGGGGGDGGTGRVVSGDNGGRNAGGGPGATARNDEGSGGAEAAAAYRRRRDRGRET